MSDLGVTLTIAIGGASLVALIVVIQVVTESVSHYRATRKKAER